MKFITRTIATYDIVAGCFDKTENKVVDVTFSTVDDVNDDNALQLARDFIETRDNNLSVIMVNAITKDNGLYRVTVDDFLRVAVKVKSVADSEDNGE